MMLSMPMFLHMTRKIAPMQKWILTQRFKKELMKPRKETKTDDTYHKLGE